jgi:hypothetical protein
MTKKKQDADPGVIVRIRGSGSVQKCQGSTTLLGWHGSVSHLTVGITLVRSECHII